MSAAPLLISSVAIVAVAAYMAFGSHDHREKEQENKATYSTEAKKFDECLDICVNHFDRMSDAATECARGCRFGDEKLLDKTAK